MFVVNGLKIYLSEGRESVEKMESPITG